MRNNSLVTGLAALLAISGLIALGLFYGLNHPFYNAGSNLFITLLLLAFGDQMLLACLLFFVRLGSKLGELFNKITSSVQFVNGSIKELMLK